MCSTIVLFIDLFYILSYTFSYAENVVRPLLGNEPFLSNVRVFLNMCEQQDDGSGHLRDVVQWLRTIMAQKGMRL